MRKTVCLDLDGVLADYSAGWNGVSHFGKPLPGAVEFTKKLSRIADIVIYTTRCCKKQQAGTYSVEELKDLVRTWLDRHGFEYTDIYTGQGKPLYAAIIDDRAVSCRPQDNSMAYELAIEEVRQLCNEFAKLDK